ncbi:MAG: DUF3267 domain-containing protein [Clostridia bacterium]|nr:DUF3267 domain-containing protein [Clostridia bacterium]
MKNYEKELPGGYTLNYHINAKDKKTGLVMNLWAFAIMLVVGAVGAIPLFVDKTLDFTLSTPVLLISYVVFMLSMVVYIVLHELVHGAAYKLLTREKLTFGMSWSCAFCGVPNIYVYRRAAIIALVAPLITFTLVLVPVSVLMYFAHPVYYILSLVLLGMHLGGCVGDGYMTYLFLRVFKSKTTLVRDTGPEQYIYTKEVSDSE